MRGLPHEVIGILCAISFSSDGGALDISGDLIYRVKDTS